LNETVCRIRKKIENDKKKTSQPMEIGYGRRFRTTKKNMTTSKCSHSEMEIASENGKIKWRLYIVDIE
jgi:hypothetical protein